MWRRLVRATIDFFIRTTVVCAAIVGVVVVDIVEPCGAKTKLGDWDLGGRRRRSGVTDGIVSPHTMHRFIRVLSLDVQVFSAVGAALDGIDYWQWVSLWHW